MQNQTEANLDITDNKSDLASSSKLLDLERDAIAAIEKVTFLENNLNAWKEQEQYIRFFVPTTLRRYEYGQYVVDELNKILPSLEKNTCPKWH